MEALMLLGFVIVGGFTVALTIESFKRGAYLWTGIMGIMSILITTFLINWVSYLSFIY